MIRVRAGLAALGVAGALAGAPASTGRLSGRVVVSSAATSKGDAGDVVVWIEGVRGAVSSGTPAVMTSDHKRFTPRVVAVSVGESVSFPNADPIFHNVFSVSGENRFDLGLYRRGRSKEKTFSTAGLVRVYCNIHPQMVGYVRVVDSRFRAVTGKDGDFAFDGVPAGAQVVRAWSEAGGEVAQNVSVRPGVETSVSLALEVAGFQLPAHKNKYGQDYPPPPADEDRY